MPNAYVLSPTSDPFNPFLSIFDTPRNSFAAVFHEHLFPTRSSLSHVALPQSNTTLQGFDTDLATPSTGSIGFSDLFSKASLNHKRSSAWSDNGQIGTEANPSYTSWPLKPSQPDLSHASTLRLQTSRCNVSDGFYLSRHRSIDATLMDQVVVVDSRRHSSYVQTESVGDHWDTEGNNEVGVQQYDSAVKRVSVTPAAISRLTYPISKGHSPENSSTRISSRKDNNSSHDNSTSKNSTNKKPSIHSVDISNSNNKSNSNTNETSPHFKTEYCAKFRESGKCPFGERCQFVHHEQELQQRSRSLTYKTQPCWSGKSCSYQQNHARCNYLHDGETAEMFDQQRGVSYAQVKRILGRRMKQKFKQQQLQQETSEAKEVCPASDILQHSPSDDPPLDPELPTCLLLALGIDLSSASMCMTNYDPQFESLHAVPGMLSPGIIPEIQDPFSLRDHFREWGGPFFEEDEDEDMHLDPRPFDPQIWTLVNRPLSRVTFVAAEEAHHQSQGQQDGHHRDRILNDLFSESSPPVSTRACYGVSDLVSGIMRRKRNAAVGNLVALSLRSECGAGYYNLW
ncbi:hypothetical protein BGZ65_012076 [Modicella reniformis]|uniref:C3H1-type domain-containing protein n=1 Tax=Modicella reniformis TaxID=1440133 RepID=A0A9P6SNY8_9FUNG|nr:hypothetical protein BGZ65_012076 [Modicella reniformis]